MRVERGAWLLQLLWSLSAAARTHAHASALPTELDEQTDALVRSLHAISTLAMAAAAYDLNQSPLVVRLRT
jgi:hypothetical protein